jgi:aspartate racemase
VAQRLTTRLDALLDAGADRIVLCCMTIHAWLPRLSDRLRAPIISLVDLLLARARDAARPSLLLCTEGSRHARLYESAPLWTSASHRIVLPDRSDQARVQTLIYDLKRHPSPCRDQFALVDDLVAAYDAGGVMSGCTELHLLCRRPPADAAPHWTVAIDPLSVIADQIVASARLACAADR